MPVRIVRQGGRRALAVDGIVQSIEVIDGEPTPGYWTGMLPDAVGERALVLGHGGGTIARLLLALEPGVTVIAVDDDAEALAVAAGHPRFACSSQRLAVLCADAFETTRRLVEEEARFGYIAVDLYRGADMVRASLARPFLRRISVLLGANGRAAFNLPRDRRTARRIRRIGQHLKLVGTTLIGLNCVVHARPFPNP